MIAVYAFGAGASLLGLSLWLERTNAITHRQRLDLIDFVFEQRDWQVLRKELDEVGFGRHFWAVALLRDPGRLYSARLAAALAEERPSA